MATRYRAARISSKKWTDLLAKLATGSSLPREDACTRPLASLISTRHDESRIQRQYVNQYSVLSARTGFKPWRLSRMEIYETISHVSTNQVWLHINSASSRVYFRPFALFSFVARGGPTCQKLPASRIPYASVSSSLIHACFLLLRPTTFTFSLSLFALHLVCTL